jgi:hypothetical protein
VASSCECGNEPSGSIKCGNFLTSYKQVSFSRRTLFHGVSKYVIRACCRLYVKFRKPNVFAAKS